MPSNNLADISVFEQIQGQANQSMGSSMSVFNDAQAMLKMAKKLNDIDKEHVATKKKLDDLEKTGKSIMVAYSVLRQKQERSMKELENIVAKGGDGAAQAAKKLESEKAIMKELPGLPYFSFHV
jgi:hypothetical protein